MTGPGPASTTFYLPAEVAQILRCSEWWVRDQARKRRIPHTRIAGGYRFTPEHVAETARLFEVRPMTPAAPTAPRRAGTATPGTAADSTEPVLRLVARTPRRVRLGAAGSAAA